MKLRPYQIEAINITRDALREGRKRVVLQLPTGSGKTIIAVKIIEMAIAKNNRVAFVVDRIALIDQTVDKLKANGIESGVIQGTHELSDRRHLPVQVISIQTLKNREHWDCELIIIDECHILHKAHQEMLSRASKIPCIGLSATPWSQGLGKYFQALLRPVLMADLIQAGHLVDMTVLGLHNPDMRGVKTTAGDFNGKETATLINRPKLNGNVVKTWLERAEGKQTLVMAMNVAHSEALRDRFAAEGVKVAHVDAGTKLEDFRQVVEAFARYEITVICSVGKLTTGFDAPNAECLVLARPTKSIMLHHQMVGRVLRPHNGKEKALILDHAGNFLRLGFMTDPTPVELDDGKPKAKTESKPTAVACKNPKCDTVIPASQSHCPGCGWARTELPEEIEARVRKMRAKHQETIERQKRDLFAGFLWIRQQRNYKPAWVNRAYQDVFVERPPKNFWATIQPRYDERAEAHARQMNRAYWKKMKA